MKATQITPTITKKVAELNGKLTELATSLKPVLKAMLFPMIIFFVFEAIALLVGYLINVGF